MTKRLLRLEIEVLGHFSLQIAGKPLSGFERPHQQLLLAYLALHAGQRVSRQHLAFTFWPDSAEKQARTNLRKALHHLRHTLPAADSYLEIERHHVTWRQTARYKLDVDAFQAAVNAADSAVISVEEHRALERAVERYRGELLPGQYAEWLLDAREQLRQTFIDCLARLIVTSETQRAYPAAIRYARRMLRTDPLHEATYRQLMRLYALNGDHSDALRIFHVCTTTLRRELDVSPSEATRQAYRQLLAVDRLPIAYSRRRIPLVGRDGGWQKLQKTWRRAAKRQPTFALLTGEAGIGKTRLAEELLDWADRQGIPTLRAACYASASRLPYAPITSWLRDAAATNSLTGLSDKWLREVSRVLPELVAERPDVTPSGPITETWQRQHLFSALAHAILRQRQPFLLFVDDLQWCDPDTLEWLSFLLHFDETARFLLLGTARSEEMARAESLLTLRDDVRHENRLVEIDLNRLNAADSAALSAHVAGSALGHEDSAALFAATEGVPLFVVELARAGFNLPEESQPASAHVEIVSAETFPPRVRSIFESRLSTLSASARDLADLAATIGRSFTFDLINRASEMSADGLVRDLDELWRQQIVREQGAEAYDFSHGLLRQVAYGALSAARRRLLHGQVAEAMETQRAAGQTVDDGQLAAHYVAIGRYQDAVAGYRRAAAQAERIFAHEEALANLQYGLALAIESNMDLLVLYEQQASVFALVGQYDAAHRALDKALTHASDPLDQSRLLHRQGKAWMAQHHRRKGLQAFDDALHCLGSQPDQQGVAWQLMWLDIQLARGGTFYFEARLDALAALIEQLADVVAAVGTLNQRRLYLELHNMHAIAQKRYRLDGDDIVLRQRISALADQIGDAHAIVSGRFSLGFHYLWAGAVDDAVSYLSTALADATEIGNRYVQDQCLAYLALAYRVQGDVEQVAGIVAQHRPISAQVGNPLYGGVLAANESWLAYHDEDWETAVARADAATAAWGKLPYPLKWTALWPLIAIRIAQNRLSDAVDYANQLLRPPQQLLDVPVANALQQAIVAWEAGERAPTHRHLADAVAHVQATHRF